jgi:iron(III) transport system ATP-binding protein
MTLSFSNVTHRYGDKIAVADFTLSVGRGELVCLVGPSGCGKSTILRLAAGLEELRSGQIAIDGQEIDPRLPPEARDTGLVFQDYALFPHLTVAENVAFGLRRGSPTERRRVALELLERFGLGAYADAYPHALSGGEQQRVAIARALAPQPRIMLLDEPFSGLDIQLRDSVCDQVLAILKAAGSPVLLVTHDPQEAMRMADRVAVLRQGRLEQVGSPAEIYVQPTNAFVASFFSPVNELTGNVQGGQVRTALGPMPCALPSGSTVRVVVRCSGIALAAEQGADPDRRVGTVVASRPLGPYSVVDVSVAGVGVPLRAHVPGRHPPVAGERVVIVVDPRQAFIFPG